MRPLLPSRHPRPSVVAPGLVLLSALSIAGPVSYACEAGHSMASGLLEQPYGAVVPAGGDLMMLARRSAHAADHWERDEPTAIGATPVAGDGALSAAAMRERIRRYHLAPASEPAPSLANGPGCPHRGKPAAAG